MTPKTAASAAMYSPSFHPHLNPARPMTNTRDWRRGRTDKYGSQLRELAQATNRVAQAEPNTKRYRKAVRRHVAGEGGTGGGGMPYLVTSQRFLLPLFPALVAYADLGVAAADERQERW